MCIRDSDAVVLSQKLAHEIPECGIGYIPQGRRLFPELTVGENLKMGLYAGNSSNDVLDWALSLFPVLKTRLKQQSGTLSGGEQQMLAIGRALMARPRILLLDEPSLGLAPMVVTEIFRTLRALRDDETTIFLVEQNARRALQVADRGYVLERGQITLEGTGQHLLDDEKIQQTYLGKRA